MNFSKLFIERPVTTTLIMIAIVFFGVVAYRVLPVSDLPNVDFPTIQVTAGLPGANPETMASAVALPLEKQFATIAGVTSINSTSYPGSTSITVQFDLARNIDAAAQDVQAMIAKAARQLPPQMPAPPSLQKVNPADQPVLILGMDSPTLPISVVSEYAQTMAQRISMVSGVAQVGFGGDQKYAVRIDVDPRWRRRSPVPMPTFRPGPCMAANAPIRCRPMASCSRPRDTRPPSSAIGRAVRSVSNRSRGSTTGSRTTRWAAGVNSATGR
jgi:HAE1 family hydrophobic/amphiphilic exporter-1